MVMRKSIQMESQRARRLGVAEAKSRLSEVLRESVQGPTIIHSRGRDVVVVLSVEEYERLTADQQPRRAGGLELLNRIEALKQRYGGGVDDFEPARLDFVPAEPFAGKKTGRR